VTSNPRLFVIAGLDPAIHGRDRRFGIMQPGYRPTGAASLDRRVKPGDDSWVVQTRWIPV